MRPKKKPVIAKDVAAVVILSVGIYFYIIWGLKAG